MLLLLWLLLLPLTVHDPRDHPQQACVVSNLSSSSSSSSCYSISMKTVWHS
jgi:hypothetical protein